jgi:hypothetical protein
MPRPRRDRRLVIAIHHIRIGKDESAIALKKPIRMTCLRHHRPFFPWRFQTMNKKKTFCRHWRGWN